MNKQLEFVLEWLSTALVIIGAALTAFDVYPLNIYFALSGNLGWLLVGISWRKWSLITIQAVVTIIYIIGLVIKGHA